MRLPLKIPGLALAGLLLTAWTWSLLKPFDGMEGFSPGAPIGRDFTNFWVGTKLALEGRFALAADLPAYNAHIVSLFAQKPDFFSFDYPPAMLLLAAPFGALPHLPALLLWTGANLAGLFTACRLSGGGRALSAFALLSPASLMMVIYGHFAGLAAFALSFSLRRGQRHPWMAGLLLGLVSVKPQLFAALALMLFFAGERRSLLVSLIVTLALGIGSALAFGTAVWELWLHELLPASAARLEDFPGAAFRSTASAYAGLRMSGLDHLPAMVLQGAISLLVFYLSWRALRVAQDAGDRALVVGLGALAILPYVNHYDLAMISPALAACLLHGRMSPLAALLWLAPSIAPAAGALSLPIVPAIFTCATLALLYERGLPVRAAGRVAAHA